MSISYYNDSTYMNNSANSQVHSLVDKMTFIKKPIEKLEDTATKIVDTFKKTNGDEDSNIENEKKKKSYKTAIKVGSTVLVISSLVALLNPKFSGKLSEKLQNLSTKLLNKAKMEGGEKGNFYMFVNKCLKFPTRIFQFSSNAISLKDTIFKWMCVDKKEFSFLNKKHKTTQKILQNIDAGCRKVLTKPYNKTTEWFDWLSKKTVINKYNSVNKDVNRLNKLLESYKDSLPEDVKIKISEKIKEISEKQQYFSKSNVDKRLSNQEVIMKDLETQTREKIKSFFFGFKSNNWGNHMDSNMNFWAKDILQKQQDKLEKEGSEFVSSLVGNNNGKKGIYNEILELIEPHISNKQKTSLNSLFEKTEQKLIKASKIENIEYFDKKRDLMLGSAPTDILTAIVGIVGSGIAIGSADNKDERISRSITVAGPVVAGFFVNLIMTAMLVSGMVGLSCGLGTSWILNKLGIKVDNTLFPEHGIKFAEKDKKEENLQEVQCA